MRTLIVGCGALGRELVTLTRDLPNVDVTCLPASLHNRPEGIPAAVRDRVAQRAGGYDRVFVAYADCGTGGLLDRLLDEEGLERLPGAHCYEVYAGSTAFAALADAEPGTFYLTDFLARNFDRLVWRGLGLDRHPELLADYFGNYRRLVYLAQTDDPMLNAAARSAAQRLALTFERRFTGLVGLSVPVSLAARPTSRRTAKRVTARPDARPTSKRSHMDPRSLAPRATQHRGAPPNPRSLAPRATQHRGAPPDPRSLAPRATVGS